MSSITALTARVAQLQALNRSYLDALRGAEESYKPYDEMIAMLQARVRELEASRAAPPPPAADTVLGCTRAQFLAGMEIILRDTGKSFPEAFALWEAHAAECAEERRQEAIANSSREGMRSVLAAWVQGGMGAKKALCTCGEWDCPTRDLAYKEDRGFVDRHTLEYEEAEAEAEAKERAAAAAAKPMTWAQRVLAGTK